MHLPIGGTESEMGWGPEGGFIQSKTVSVIHLDQQTQMQRSPLNSDSNCFHIPSLPNLSVFWCCFLLGLVTHRCTHPSRWGGSRGLFTGGGGASVVQLTLQDIARSLRDRQHKRVAVMAGAGISTPSGIPDFRLARKNGRKNVSCALPLTTENTCRSPGSGLYDNLQQYDLPYAEAIFEIGFFHRNPAPFFALAKELYPGNYRPNPTHFFVHLLHQKGQLLRMYTQNIDGLERLAGIPPEKLVEAHGTFATATCTSCLQKYKGEELQPAVMSGSVPKCSACGGVVKPDIVFFGEELPPRFLKYLTDFPLADLLIIMGTSLEVRKSSFCLNWSEKQFSCAAGRRSPRHAGATLAPCCRHSSRGRKKPLMRGVYKSKLILPKDKLH
uniref:Sirtuin 3 n=1 Tax=Oryzias sinensis TaxID=183150 RepID=A0A8C7XCM5_9TELE